MTTFLTISLIYNILAVICIISIKLLSEKQMDRYIVDTILIYPVVILIAPYYFFWNFYEWNFTDVDSNKLGKL